VGPPLLVAPLSGGRDGTGDCCGLTAQAARIKAVAIIAPRRAMVNPALCVISLRRVMTLLLLEALLALFLLIFIVWWTMFSGRKNGEIKTEEPAPPQAQTSHQEPTDKP
jgi:hypothetical protein